MLYLLIETFFSMPTIYWSNCNCVFFFSQYVFCRVTILAVIWICKACHIQNRKERFWIYVYPYWYSS